MKEPRLSLAFVRQVRTPGKYYDSFGLILVVSAGGAKRWIQRLTVNGRRRDIGLGSALTTTPAAARAMAAKNREVARAGGNPLAGVKDRPVPTPRKGMSLAGFSRAVNLRGLALGDKRAARERYATLSRHLHPILGRQLLRDLTPEMIHGALMRIREEKARTAMTVRGHLIALLGEAVSDGLIPENPADRLETRIPAPAKLTTAGGDAKAARVLDQLPAFLEAMMTTSRRPNLMRLLRFMLLTLRAPQECRLARWEQFDIPGRSWTFPLRQHEGNEIQRFELFDVHLDILHEARASGVRAATLPWARLTTLRPTRRPRPSSVM